MLNVTTTTNPAANLSEQTVQERLTEIAAAVAAASGSGQIMPQASRPPRVLACPIDPAERAACDSCQ